jgi:hypothetical protein
MDGREDVTQALCPSAEYPKKRLGGMFGTDQGKESVCIVEIDFGESSAFQE